MSRGLSVVISGFLPILLLSMLGDSVDRGTGSFLVALGFLCTAGLFMWGTTLIVVDKGHPLSTGLLLGLIAPLGTAFAILLPDQRNLEIRQHKTVHLNAPAIEQAVFPQQSSGFDRTMQIQERILWPSTCSVGVLIGVLSAWHLLSFPGGIPAAKFIIGLSMGAFYGLAFCGTIVFWPLVFAPRNWLLNTERGRTWMKRTGLNNPESTIPLRVMSLVIAIISSAMFCLFILVAIETATKRPHP